MNNVDIVHDGVVRYGTDEWEHLQRGYFKLSSKNRVDFLRVLLACIKKVQRSWPPGLVAKLTYYHQASTFLQIKFIAKR